MSKPIIVSGIQPTGNLHIGNYLGAVKNWVELQNSNKYQMYIFIADLHSLTGNMTPEARQKQVKTAAAELIAAGIDPKKTTIFIQSQVSEHTELAWIFNCVAPVGELKRMTQYKDKAGLITYEQQFKHELHSGKIVNTMIKKINDKFPTKKTSQLDSLSFNRNELAELIQLFTDDQYLFLQEYEKMTNKTSIGLLTYPILQAADILLYKGEAVPVGQDQVQHVELTRDIARWFNNRYGVYFTETKPLLTSLPKIMSLLEPTKKMSKSLGEGHVLELADEPEVILTKLKKAVTATEGGGSAPGVENLLLLLKQFADKTTYDQFVAAEKSKAIRYGELKEALAKAVADYFKTFRAERAKLLKDEKKLNKILEAGANEAKKVAAKTMAEVKKMVGLV